MTIAQLSVLFVKAPVLLFELIIYTSVVLVAAAGIVAAVVAVGAAAVVAAVMVATSACVIAATVVVTAATATVGGLKFFGGSVAHGLHLTLETHVLAGERVVEVHDYLSVGHILDETVDTETVGGHHRHESARLDHLGVKFTVDHEDVFLQSDNLLGVVGTESLTGLYLDVIFAAGFETVESGFERFYHAAGHAENKLFGVFGVNLMYEFLAAVGIYLIQIVSDFDIFAGFDFFHNYYI